MARLRSVDQLALDERRIDDPEIEAALQEREDTRVEVSEARKLYQQAHERALAKIEQLELPEGAAVRVGSFRIEKKSIPSRSVSFETDPKVRVSITLAKDE